MIAIILGIITVVLGLLLVGIGVLVVGAKLLHNPIATFILGWLTRGLTKNKH